LSRSADHPALHAPIEQVLVGMARQNGGSGSVLRPRSDLLSHLPVAARIQVYDRGAGTAGGAGFDPPRQPVISQPGQGE
jgi:hypothetical protein